MRKLKDVIGESPKTTEVKPRPRRRTGIAGPRNVLTVEGKEDGFKYRVVNVQGDRVERMQDRGYEVVTHAVRVGDSRAGKAGSIGSAVEINIGGGRKATLMRIKDEFYKEDLVDKEALVKRTEEQMRAQAKQSSDYGKFDVERK